MVKRGLLIGLMLVSLLTLPVLAQPSDCKGTHLQSYKEYGVPNVARAWDSYSAQTEGVCTLDSRPKTGECRFVYELRRETDPSVWICWYGEGKPEVSTGDLTGLCKETYLPGYDQYKLPSVRQLWDSYSAKSDGVCRYDRPAVPKEGDCKFKFELATPERGVQAVLCWYDEKKTVKPLPQPIPSRTVLKGDVSCIYEGLPGHAMDECRRKGCEWEEPDCICQYSCADFKECSPLLYSKFGPGSGIEFSVARQRGNCIAPEPQGWFSRLKNWFSGIFTSKGWMPFSESAARDMFFSQIISRAELPDDAVGYMYDGVLPAGSTIKDGIFNSITTENDMYFAWIDPFPDMLYAHPTFYLFLYEDANVQVKQGNGWAVVNGEDLRQVGNSILGSSSPTGGLITGFQTGTVPRNAPAPSGDFSVGETFVADTSDECPPGYVKRDLPPGKEEGHALAVAQPVDPKIDFMSDANKFIAATGSADFKSMGVATSPGALQSAMASAQSLPETSSFAMFISSHGVLLWNVEIVNSETGDKRQLSNFPDIMPTDSSFGLPEGYHVASKKQTGWCFQLGNQCIAFDTNAVMGSVPSCRKFLASSACFSGALVEHNVEGLSVYSGSQKDRPGLAVNKKSIFGEAFTNALASNVPKDPEKPQDDEPKPEFDSAFNVAASAVSSSKLQGKRLSFPLGSGRTLSWKVDQKAVMHSVPHKLVCQDNFECVPSSGPPLTDPGSSDCASLKANAAAIPSVLNQVFAAGDAYEYDQLAVFGGMIRDLESLKSCYSCPPGQSPSWKGCEPYGDALKIIDMLIEGLRAIVQNQYFSLNPASTVQAVQELVNKLSSCKLECRSSSGFQPQDGVLMPGGDIGYSKGACRALGIAELFDDRVSCKRYCTYGDCDRVPASAVATRQEMDEAGAPLSLRCWFCRPDEQESVVDDLIGSSPDDWTGSVDDWSFDCTQECINRGLSIQRPSSASILQQLQQYTCVSGASIKLQRTRIGESCECYGDAQINVDQTKPVCKGTPCGDVTCGESRQCSVDGTQWTVSCSWGGWEEITDYSYRPVIGTV